MKKINIEDAVGTVLAHDMTRIVRGKFKGVGFKKGHVVKKEDLPELLKIGKRSLYVLNLSKNQLHEDDAALRIASAVSGSRLEWTEPREGKINIISKVDGLFKVEIQNLLKVNKLGSIILATLKNNFPCKKGQIVASTRIIPLVIPAKKIEQLEKLIHQTEPILRVKQFKKMKVGAVVTGSEIYNGLIKDDFDPTIGRKIKNTVTFEVRGDLFRKGPKTFDFYHVFPNITHVNEFIRRLGKKPNILIKAKKKD